MQLIHCIIFFLFGCKFAQVLKGLNFSKFSACIIAEKKYGYICENTYRKDFFTSLHIYKIHAFFNIS